MVSNQVVFFGTLVSGNYVLVQGLSRFVAIGTICLSAKSDTVATNSKITSSSLYCSDSDIGDESKNDDESLDKAY